MSTAIKNQRLRMALDPVEPEDGSESESEEEDNDDDSAGKGMKKITQ